MASERDDDGPERKESVKYWEIIADNTQENAGWSLDYVSTVDPQRRTVWIVDAHRGGKRYVMHAEEKLTAFLELELQLAVKGMAF